MDEIQVLAETEEFGIWRILDPDEGMTYHIEFGNVTIHLFEDEWEQFRELLEQL